MIIYLLLFLITAFLSNFVQGSICHFYQYHITKYLLEIFAITGKYNEESIQYTGHNHESMEEVDDHDHRKHWSTMHGKDFPIGAKTILAIWSLKHKGFSDGSIQTYKAKFCAHGSIQTWRENH